MVSSRAGLAIPGLLIGLLALQGSAQSPKFTYQKVMVPVRDGVRLETVIMTPTPATGPLPILFRRTPYGVPGSANGVMAATIEAVPASVSVPRRRPPREAQAARAALRRRQRPLRDLGRIC